MMKKFLLGALFFTVFISFLLSILPSVLSYSDVDSSPDFESIPEPTAEDLEALPNPTIEDFTRLSYYEQREYLLREYNSEFASAFIETSNFAEPEDRVIAQQYFSDDPENINNNPEIFTAYLEQEGIEITISGPVVDYDAKGNLYGTNQQMNLKSFKNSPATDEYAITIDPEGNILLSRKEGYDFTSFTGALKIDKAGRFSIADGTINGNVVKGASELEFDDAGDIAGGKVTQYQGIIFSEPTIIKTEEKGTVLGMSDAVIVSVSQDTDLKVYGSADFLDYNKVSGKLVIPYDKYFLAKNVLIYADSADVELRMGDLSSTERGVDFVRLTDQSITLNGKSPQVLFNAQDFAAGAPAQKKFDVIFVSSLGTVEATTDGKRLTITGKYAVMQLGEEIYTTKKGKLYKSENTDIEVLPEAVAQEQLTTLGMPVDIVPREEGGVALSIENEYAALKEGTEKPTVTGVAVQGAKLATAYLSGDAEAIQERINTINEKLESGVGITKEDQEFLVALYSGISVGGYVKAGPNAGNALRHYFTGNGEQLDVDAEMFLKSVGTQTAMVDMEEEVKRQITEGKSSGTFSSVNCDCVVNRETPQGNPAIENGIINTYSNIDPELFYTNHNFYLVANYQQTTSGETEVVWTVDDPYDFKRIFDEREKIELPIPFSDNIIVLPDGIANALAMDLNLAKPYNVHAEWKTTLK